MEGRRIWYHLGNMKGKGVMSEEKPKRKYTISDEERERRRERVRKAAGASAKSRRRLSASEDWKTLIVPPALLAEIDKVAERTGAAGWKIVARAIALLKKHGYEAKLEARKKPAG
jgi:hypothetical protein